MQSVLITKQNIMFSAWQPNDGTWDFPIVCIWMHMMLEREKNDYGLYQTARSGSEERRQESLRCSMGLDPLLRPFVFVLLYALLMDCTKR